MNTDTIQMSLFDYFMEDEQFTIPEATALVKEQKKLQVNDESIRARIYEGLELGIFKRVARGVYKVESQLNKKTATCLLINGDGRDLSFIEDNSIDGIITDHPYDLAKSLTGGNRKFATYELFKYTKKDFQEKMRVLKEGAFCVELLPEENEVNYQYLYEVKQMAIKEGFKYFAKVPWIKGDFKANTGRIREKKKKASALKKAENRQNEIDRLFAKMYEDRACEKITERNFIMLSGKYQKEQIELEQQITNLREELSKMEQDMIGAEKWIELIKEYSVPKELTAPLLNAMIEKILIHEATTNEENERIQEIEIYYRFIGKVD